MLWGRIAKVKVSLRVVHDTHAETPLLHSCFALLGSPLSSTPVPLVTCICPKAKHFDITMRDSLESLSGGPISEWSWQNASLPIVATMASIFAVLLFVPFLFISNLAYSPGLWLR